MSYQHYQIKTAQTLALFQFLEESIRTYLAQAFELIKKSIPSSIAFKYSYDDLRKDSLGTLLSKVEKIYPHDDDFIVKAKRLVKKRNDCAHKGFLHFKEEMEDNEFALDQIAEMDALYLEVRELLDGF